MKARLKNVVHGGTVPGQLLRFEPGVYEVVRYNKQFGTLTIQGKQGSVHVADFEVEVLEDEA